MRLASLIGFLLSQLCSCFEVVKAVHIGLLSWIAPALFGRPGIGTCVLIRRQFLCDVGYNAYGLSMANASKVSTVAYRRRDKGIHWPGQVTETDENLLVFRLSDDVTSSRPVNVLARAAVLRPLIAGIIIS